MGSLDYAGDRYHSCVVALHDFTPIAENITCLSFHAGQIIQVLNREASGWWDGELEGQRGWFPSNHVREIHQMAGPKEDVLLEMKKQSRSPLLTPLLHTLSMMRRAVADRRQAHYQPLTAHILSCVQRLFTSTNCLARDAPVLRCVPQLAQERNVVLGNVATLVSQTRRCSDWHCLASDEDETWNNLTNGPQVERQNWELVQMLRMGGEVRKSVTLFLEVCEQNGIEPLTPRTVSTRTRGSRSSESGSETDTRATVELGITTPMPTTTPHEMANCESTAMLRSRREPRVPRNVTSGHDPSPGKTAKRRAKSMNGLRELRRMERAERIQRMGTAPMPMRTFTPHEKGEESIGHPHRTIVQIQRPKQPSISSTPPLPPGSNNLCRLPVTTPSLSILRSPSSETLSALCATHDDLLSTLAAFIGLVHSYGRDSEVSSKADLIELARETVDTVRQLLPLVEPFVRHPDMGGSRVGTLQTAKASLFTATSDFGNAVREMTAPAATAVGVEETRRTLNGATDVLRAAADCVAAAKLCLSRPTRERPFFIQLPDFPSRELFSPLSGAPRSASRIPDKPQWPISHTRRRYTSLTSLHDQEQSRVSQNAISETLEDGTTRGRSRSRRSFSEQIARKPTQEPFLQGMPSGLGKVDADPSIGSSSWFEASLLHDEMPAPPPQFTVPSTPVGLSPWLPPLDFDSLSDSIRYLADDSEVVIDDAIPEAMLQPQFPAASGVAQKELFVPDAFDRNSDRCLDGRITRPNVHLVAFGGYADVWEGFLGDQKVAIKTVRRFSASGKQIPDSKLCKRLRREYLAWYCLSHPNVLPCLGFSFDFSPSNAFPSLISPWMTHGSVFRYLEHYPDTDRLKLLLGVARGVAYLHDRAITHGDLRAGNILILDSGVPCLSDFGLSRILQVEEMTTTSELAGSLRWMSPELLVENMDASPSSDVWAYGMTLLEIISGNRPYHEFKKDAIVFGQIKDGYTPSRPEGTDIPYTLSDEVWGICQACWTLRPTERPSMHEVHHRVLACQSHHGN